MPPALFDGQQTQLGHLVELCPVVEGAIVSKALLDTGSIKQILFSMDRGQFISQHKAPFVATVQMLSGRLKFCVGGAEHELAEYDWLVMPPDEPHDLSAVAPAVFLLTLVKK